MIAFGHQFPGPTLELFAAADLAIAQVPPAFPLEATVAVNPYLGQSGVPRTVAAQTLARVGAGPLTPPRASFAAALAEGSINDADLAASGADPDTLRAAASAPATPPEILPTLADLAARATLDDWPGLVIDRIGAWAGGQFDTGQALWAVTEAAPYASWRRYAMHDLTPGLRGLPTLAPLAEKLPDHPQLAFAQACERLGLTPDMAPTYFHRLMVDLGGWGQLARGVSWRAARDGGHDGTAFALLTVRLTWELALLEHFGEKLDWLAARTAFAAPPEVSETLRQDMALQEASDRAAERRLAETLDMAAEAQSVGARDGAERQQAPRPAFQAAFCIDVRSEVFRRALERTDPDIQTLGFAGFFGLSTAHRAAASDVTEMRGPMLLPAGTPSHSTDADDGDLRITRRATRAWGRFRAAAVSAFAFVEAAGPLYAAKLCASALGGSFGPTGAPDPRPRLDMPLDDKVTAAAGILGAISLTEGFARLVLVAGHGADVTNAPHASALQCGACGGHAGDVNARLLAGLLNDPEVRAGLHARGLVIPDDTRFIAGLHDTVSDRVRLFQDDPAPDHREDIARLKAALASAGVLARTERAARLPRAKEADSLQWRGADWSEVRPEWGLAGCAAFIAAPRARTAGADLDGAAFLHSYDWRKDAEFAVLETILTAPVVVASWIALQYHGSAVAPATFGAGNKLLHNAIGGIGVIEGTHGPLRTGLPWQSVHDGEAFRHTARRLAVVVAAPPAAILGILGRHAELKALFDNGWLSLHRMDDAGRISARYEGGRFVDRSDFGDIAVAA